MARYCKSTSKYALKNINSVMLSKILIILKRTAGYITFWNKTSKKEE